VARARIGATGDRAIRRAWPTGCFGTALAEGTLRLEGTQVSWPSLAGNRVSLGQAEEALQHALVREVAIASRMGRLIAYVVPVSDSVRAVEIEEIARDRLVSWMVPHVVLVDALPRTPSGALDVGALPSPASPSETRCERIPPRSAHEEMIAVIWKEVLGLSFVGVHDDFFRLGGHSLRAMQVIARVEERLGVRLSPRDFFAAPTVAGIARAPAGAPIAEATPPPILRAEERATAAIKARVDALPDTSVDEMLLALLEEAGA
jgi:acyl carrier protein